MNIQQFTGVAAVVGLTLSGATCTAQFENVQMRRGQEAHRYRLEISGPSPQEKTAAIFDLRSTADGVESFVILQASHRSEAGEMQPFELDSQCLQDFGGDEQSLGRVTLKIGAELDEMIPPCVPETLWVAVTDILGFLTIQSEPDFRAGELKRAGDRVRFGALEVAWHRPLERIQARLSFEGGVTSLHRIENGRAYLRWEPETILATMVRAVPGMPDTMMLMDLQEQFAMEIEVDPKTGALLGGRSLFDNVDISIWLPYSESSLPATKERPEQPTRQLSVSRQLTLELIQ